MDKMKEDAQSCCTSGCCKGGAGWWVCAILGLVIGAIAGWLLVKRRGEVAACFRERLGKCGSKDSIAQHGQQELVLELSVQAAGPAPAAGPVAGSATAAPDDLTLIHGIGAVFAARLAAAGIRSFEQLATASEEKLGAAIAADAWLRPDFADWIRQAAERMHRDTE